MRKQLLQRKIRRWCFSVAACRSMGYFTRPIEAVETVPHGKPAEHRLAEIQRECEAVEKAFNETFRALAEHDAHRMRLVTEQSRVAARRTALFSERIALFKELGKIT